MPIYEFSCTACGERFEELVGSHVGLEPGDARCPACGAAGAERLATPSYAPIRRTLTPNQRRRLEAKRGTDRGGAKERFERSRAAARRRAGGGGA